MSVPDPLGRDRLVTGAAMYRPPVYGQKPPARPLLRRPWVIALLLVLVLVVAAVVVKLASRSTDTPASAATAVIRLFLAEDYAAMRNKLCRDDRGQVGENDLETAGREMGALLRTLDKPRVESVVDVRLTGGYATVRAKQVLGHIAATVGTGTAFKVITVREGGTWRVCLSPGGYGLSAFNLDVPVDGTAGD